MSQQPVLAKRKTQIMRDQEAHQQGKEAEKKRRLSNKASRERQMKMPGVDTLDYERQLRKVATRGGEGLVTELIASRLTASVFAVIALFNAIFQAKKDAEVLEEDSKSSKYYRYRCRRRLRDVITLSIGRERREGVWGGRRR